MNMPKSSGMPNKPVRNLQLGCALSALLLAGCAQQPIVMPSVSVNDCPKPPELDKAVLDPPAPSPGSFSAALQVKVNDWQKQATQWQTSSENAKPK